MRWTAKLNCFSMYICGIRNEGQILLAPYAALSYCFEPWVSFPEERKKLRLIS